MVLFLNERSYSCFHASSFELNSFESKNDHIIIENWRNPYLILPQLECSFRIHLTTLCPFLATFWGSHASSFVHSCTSEQHRVMLLLYFAIIYEKDVNSYKLHNGAKLFEKSHLNFCAPGCSIYLLVFGCWIMNHTIKGCYKLNKLTFFTQNGQVWKIIIILSENNCHFWICSAFNKS